MFIRAIALAVAILSISVPAYSQQSLPVDGQPENTVTLSEEASSTAMTEPVTSGIPLAEAARFDQHFASRLSALEINKKSFEETLQFVKWAAFIAGLMVAALGVLGIKTLFDVKAVASKQAADAIAQAVEEGNESGDSLSKLIEKSQLASVRLIAIENELRGYTLLANTAATASGFDPLSQYHQMRHEISRGGKKRDRC